MMAYMRQQGKGVFTIPSPENLTLHVVGKHENPIDYSAEPSSVRHAEKSVLAGITGIPRDRMIMLNQVHGDDIIAVESYPEKDIPFYADADGLLTTLPGLCLVIRTADCVPVFAVDPQRGVLGAVHSGWRGCRLDIAGKLIMQMQNGYRCAPENIHVFILPAIGAGSYTVNEDVASFFPRHTARSNGKILVDLPGSIHSSVSGKGVPDENIALYRRCTMVENETFFSHRMGDAGRNLNAGFLVPR
jgi:YfiH family protein